MHIVTMQGKEIVVFAGCSVCFGPTHQHLLGIIIPERDGTIERRRC